MPASLYAGLGAAAAAALTAGAHGLWRRRFGPPPPALPGVLAYHKVGTPELGGTWCTRRQFAAHLETLRRAGWTGIDATTFESRLARLHEPRSTAQREFLVTFDDAYAGFASQAWPILQRHAVPVLLFVISEFVGKRARWDLPFPGRRVQHLDWDELRTLQRQGVAIGSHGATHRDLRRLPARELQRELAGSKARLEDALGCAVAMVSYPFGRFDAAVVAAARAAGYRLGFSMCPAGRNDQVQPWALRRHGVYVIDAPRAILDKVDGTRRMHWLQDLLTRGINAVAEVPARWGGAGTGRADGSAAGSTPG